MHNLTNAMKQIREKAYTPKESKCSICNTNFLASSNIELFSCAHSFHQSCLEQMKKKGRCPVCYGDIKGKKEIAEEEEKDEEKIPEVIIPEVDQNEATGSQSYVDRLNDFDQDEVSRYRILRLFERDVNIYDYTGARLNLAPLLSQTRTKKIKARRPGTMDPKPKNASQMADEDVQELFDFKAARKNQKGSSSRNPTIII